MKPFNKTLTAFRYVALAEGISFLVLLLIAMPIKYGAGIQWPVKVMGWTHGVLLIVFLALAYEAKVILNKPFKWLVLAFAVSLLPAGTFWLDRQLGKEGAWREM